MSDTDGGGVLHFAAPYRWAEAAYAEWRAGLGHSIASDLRDGFAAPVVASGAEYLRQIRADDVVAVTLWTSAEQVIRTTGTAPSAAMVRFTARHPPMFGGEVGTTPKKIARPALGGISR